MANFEVFLWNFSSSITLFFLKSPPGSKNDNDISNDEVINQASPVSTPISDDKPLNIQCSTINESSEYLF